MKPLPARWILLACFALACIWICSCSDDEDCVTCPAQPDCADPTKALLGSWVLFESYTNGVRDEPIAAIEMDFETNDRLIVSLEGFDTLTWWWMADETHILMGDPDGSASAMKFEYGFEADTLDLNSVNADDDYYWRLHRK